MGNIVITSLLIFTFVFLNTRWCSCNGNSPRNNSTLKCKPSERAALLNLKHNLTYFDEDVSSSWEGVECCQWKRVICDTTTGHVVELDLNGNDTNHLLKMEKIESMVYLLELRQLKWLDMSDNNFNYNSIPGFMDSMKQLWYLDLSSASLGGLVPSELSNLTNLQVLRLSNNMLLGEIPAVIGKLSNLEELDLSKNNLSSIASSLRFPSNLELLLLDNNKLSGKIPTSLGQLSKLHILDIASNPLKDTVLSEFHLANLSSLKDLNMGDTMLTLNMSSDWVSPFQLVIFEAKNCKINGQIPSWLQTSKNLAVLNLYNANISGIMPSWFHTMPHLYSLDLSNNQINSRIPDSLCQLSSLGFLDIQNNSLSGVIPNCLANMSSLSFVRLSYNKLTGHIPFFKTRDSNKSESRQLYLHLNDNMLSGEIPSSLSGFTHLKVLDIGGNQLSGKMLNWFSTQSFKKLNILRLRGNKFSGPIPRLICSLPHLQLLDLGHNHFTGSIPSCLSNLTAMISPDISSYFDVSDVSEVIQGIEREYTSTLPYLVDIDLSCNNLVGSIPDDVTKISGLLSFNLSYNQLSGPIPVNIGGLKSLISLDLSMNELRGSIPTSIGEIYTLSHLNLSYNNLSGQIPTGNQLQVLSDQASIYAGNPYLCADFLPNKCKADKQVNGTIGDSNGNNKEKLKTMGFDLVVLSGFATGFWGVVGSLVLNRRWRHAVFRRVEDGYNWLYVVVALRVAKARR